MNRSTLINAREFEQPRDMSLTILEDNGFLSIIGARQRQVQLPHIKQRDVTQINRYMFEAAEHLVGHVYSGGSRQQLPEVLMDFSKGLAARGYRMKQRVFGESSELLNPPPEESTEIPFVEINSDTFIIPWEWLYDRDIGELHEEQDLAEVLRHFWGFNRVIARRSLESSRVAYHDQTQNRAQRQATDIPRIGLVIDDSLTYAREERAYFTELATAGVISLAEFDLSLMPDEEREYVPELNHFLSDPSLDIIHFACHADADDEVEFNSYLQLGKKKDGGYRKYYVGYFDDNPRVSIASPLIVLNACSTGIRNPFQTFGFVRTLQQKGAQGIVAIESAIESQVAENFATAFYDQFLNGQSLGTAIFAARRRVLNSDADAKDILALFYSLYADPYMRLRD